MNEISQIRQHINEKRPLILNITNIVTADFVANGLLSLGASPIMSQSLEEMEELIRLAAAVVINIGTLNEEWMRLVLAAGKIANAFKKPIILDPVGAGATHLRTAFCQQLLSTLQISIVRGNASEIMALVNRAGQTKGVDSSIDTEFAVESAQLLAQQYNIVTAMSGAVDVIADSHRIQKIARGSVLMPLVTGTGCLLSAVVAAFHAVHANAFEASFYASYFFACCGESAAAKTAFPGSFKMHFIDALNQPINEFIHATK